jgi:hypothetical protein
MLCGGLNKKSAPKGAFIIPGFWFARTLIRTQAGA